MSESFYYHPLQPTKLMKCKGCGCTDDDCRVCFHRSGRPCTWVKEDWCSCCEAMGPPTNPKQTRDQAARLYESRVKLTQKARDTRPPEVRSRRPLNDKQARIISRFVHGDFDLAKIAADFGVCQAYIEKLYFRDYLAPTLLARVKELESKLAAKGAA